MAAPTRQQTVKSNSAAATSVQVTLTSVQAGALIVVMYACSTSIDSPSDPGAVTISDTQSNSYTARTTTPSSSPMRTAILTAVASNSGSITITASVASGSPSWALFAHEVRGFDGTGGPTEKTGATEYFSDATGYPKTLTLGATTNAEQLFLGFCAGGKDRSRAWNPSSGWDSVDEYASLSDRPNMCVLSRAVTSTGTYNPSWDAEYGWGSVLAQLHAISVIAGSDGLGAVPKPQFVSSPNRSAILAGVYRP